MPTTQPFQTRPASRTQQAPGSRLAPPAEDVSSHFPVVGIGASAGGLDACKKLVSALPAVTGMAFVLIQHLDPTHQSMMVDLLSGHTTMTVSQANNGMPIEREHLYVPFPPGTYLLSVMDGVLRLSPPQARHGARLPFDFLLHSLASDRGASAICVVLSGSGADGSLGLKSIRQHHGFVIAQDPEEAGFDGMPRNAIMTGAVDQVLGVEENTRGFGHMRPPYRFDADRQRSVASTGRARLVAQDHRSSARRDGARFRALQARHATSEDRTAHGDGGDRNRQR